MTKHIPLKQNGVIQFSFLLCFEECRILVGSTEGSSYLGTLAQPILGADDRKHNATASITFSVGMLLYRLLIYLNAESVPSRWAFSVGFVCTRVRPPLCRDSTASRREQAFQTGVTLHLQRLSIPDKKCLTGLWMYWQKSKKRRTNAERQTPAFEPLLIPTRARCSDAPRALSPPPLPQFLPEYMQGVMVLRRRQLAHMLKTRSTAQQAKMSARRR